MSNQRTLISTKQYIVWIAELVLRRRLPLQQWMWTLQGAFGTSNGTAMISVKPQRARFAFAPVVEEWMRLLKFWFAIMLFGVKARFPKTVFEQLFVGKIHEIAVFASRFSLTILHTAKFQALSKSQKWHRCKVKVKVCNITVFVCCREQQISVHAGKMCFL